MAEQILFDRLAYVDRLKRAGIADEHARAHAEAMDEALRESAATKADVSAVRADIQRLEVATRADVSAVRADIQRLEVATKRDLDLLRRDMIITTGSSAIALFAALASIKFFS